MSEPLDEGRGFVLAFAACAALVLLPLWAVKYPPMVDLPQHAAQIELWRTFDELDPAVRADLELRPLTPYLGCYLLGRLLFAVFSPLAAIKVLASIAFLALPAATLLLLRVFERSRWWALAAFPLAYSVNASWGLLNFLLAMPLAVVVVATAAADAREERPRRGLAIFGLALLLLLTHGMVCAFALAIAGALALAATRSPGDFLRRAAPLVPAGIAGVAWFAATSGGESQVAGNAQWTTGPRRLLELPIDFLAIEYGWVASAVSAALALVVATAIRRLPGDRRARLIRLAPLLAAVAVYLLGPSQLFLAAFLHHRFAPFVLLFTLPLVVAGDPGRWRKLALVGLMAVASLDLTARSLGFDAEARGLDVVMESMAPGKRVLGLVFDRSVPSLPRGSHLVQQVAWVQLEKGGWVDFSFAFFYVQLVHLREPAKAGYTYLLQWRPQTFDPRQWGDYDYFVVHRAGPDPGPALFREAPFPWHLRDRAGSWWLYERLDRDPARPVASPPTG